MKAELADQAAWMRALLQSLREEVLLNADCGNGGRVLKVRGVKVKRCAGKGW